MSEQKAAPSGKETGLMLQGFNGNPVASLAFFVDAMEQLAVWAGLIVLLSCYQVLFNDRVLYSPWNFTQKYMHALVLCSKMLHIAD